MNLRTLKFEQFTNDEIAVWSAIQRAEPALASPYFRPEFTQVVAAVRTDVEVAVLEDEGKPIGFLPFQRSWWNVGRPVGSFLSDFHGLIAPAGVKCDPLELLRGCRLTTWHFDNLVSKRASFAPFIWRGEDAPYADLTDGMEAYLARRDNGRRMMSEYGQKRRKLAREVGPIRYEYHVPDRALLSTLFGWKSDQYRRTNVPNVFGRSWVRKLLEKLLEFDGDDFASVLSVMHAGDSVAAINFGMRSRQILHSWFPVYNVELSRYSPGYLHWIEILKAAESHGIQRIDLGKGGEPFKRRLMSGATTVAEGTVDLRPSATMLRRAWRITRSRIQASALHTSAKVPMRFARRVQHWLSAGQRRLGGTHEYADK